MATKISEELLDRLLACIHDGPPRTYQELAAAMGCTIQTMNAATRTLHERHQIRIADFRRSMRNGNMMPLYEIGNGPDVQLPENEAKRKHSHEYLMRERAWLKESRSRAKPFRSWIDVALFGEAPELKKATEWTGRVVKQSMSAHDEEMEAA